MVGPASRVCVNRGLERLKVVSRGNEITTVEVPRWRIRLFDF